MLALFLFLLDRKIKAGPPDPPDADETASLPNSFGEIFRNPPHRASSVVDDRAESGVG